MVRTATMFLERHRPVREPLMCLRMLATQHDVDNAEQSPLRCTRSKAHSDMLDQVELSVCHTRSKPEMTCSRKEGTTDRRCT